MPAAKPAEQRVIQPPVSFPRATWDAVKALAKRRGTTPSALVQMAVAVMMDFETAAVETALRKEADDG